MIDTIKLLIPLNDKEFLEQIKSKLTRTRRENLNTNEMKYEYFTSEIETKSYSRKITIYLNQKIPQGIFVEFSVPKQKFNNNVEMIRPSEVSEVLENFRNELCEHLKETLPPLSEWIVYRLDICHNWTFETKEKCQSLMNFIQRIDYPRKKKGDYDTSVMYKGTTYTIKFYLKGAEFLKHDFKALQKTDNDKTHELLNWAHKVIRFEVEFRKGYLPVLFGKEKVYLSDIAEDVKIEKFLQDYLASVFKYIAKENISRENVRELILQNFKPSKAYHLYQFYKGWYYNKDEKEMIKNGLNASTIWRYKTDLKKIGVSFTENIEDEKFVPIEELIIPSKRAKFILLDYKSGEYYS